MPTFAMFRFIALCWRPASPAQEACARQWAQALQQAGPWRTALRIAGLQVYVRDERPGGPRIHALPGNQGVILGQLFRNGSDASTGDAVQALTPAEADRVIHSEGRSLTCDFWGRYVAFLPSWTNEPRVLRDPSGLLPCFRTELDGVGLAFSWLEDVVAALPLGPRLSVDWELLAALMLRGSLSGRYTALREIQQVLPGELTGLLGTSAAARPLWSALDIARSPVEWPGPEAAQQLRHTVVRCVQAWASCHDKILLRLSGGIDSAIVLSSLAQAHVATRRIACLNYYSAGADSDERFYARLVASHVGCRLIEQARNTQLRLSDMLNVALTPTPASYLGRMGTGIIDARIAAETGADVMFTGSGGDQVFFERRCDWPAADYLQQHGLSRHFLRVVVEAAHLGRVSVWQCLQHAFQGRSRAEPAWDRGPMTRQASLAALEQVERAVHPALADAADLPIGKFHQLAELTTPGECHDPYLRAAAPALVMPLRSQPVVEMSLRTPTYLLTQGGTGRALARRAFAEDLPAALLARRSKGGTGEHVRDVLDNQRELARTLLLEGRLMQAHILDRRRVQAALADRPSADAVHPGDLHNAMAVEAWLRQHERLTTGRSG